MPIPPLDTGSLAWCQAQPSRVVPLSRQAVPRHRVELLQEVHHAGGVHGAQDVGELGQGVAGKLQCFLTKKSECDMIYVEVKNRRGLLDSTDLGAGPAGDPVDHHGGQVLGRQICNWSLKDFPADVNSLLQGRHLTEAANQLESGSAPNPAMFCQLLELRHN